MKAKQSLCITPSESQREVEPLPQLGRSLSSNCSPPSLPLNPYRGHSPAWLPAVEFCRYCPLRYRCSTFSSWARVSSTPQASSPAECSVALRGHLGSYISLPTPTRNNAGHVRDTGSITGSGRSPGGGHGNPLQYSCLENPWTEGAGGLQSIGLQRVGHD